MKFFNTAGPISTDDHYCIPPLSRFDLEEILMLIAQKKYFILHAPRQTVSEWGHILIIAFNLA
jgi:hypothetical protein